EADLATGIGVSARHLRRLFLRHLGATPDQLARSRRAHFARRLLDDTDLPVADVAFASGFGSLRQFNRAMLDVFRASPTDLRARRHRADRLAVDGGLAVRLPVMPGYDWATVLDVLTGRAIPGVEAADKTAYRRTITMAGAPGLLDVSPAEPGYLLLHLHLPYWEGLIHVVANVARLVGAETGRAAAGWSPFEIGVRELLDRPLLNAFAATLGEHVPGLPDDLTLMFPAPAAVTEQAVGQLALPDELYEGLLRLAATTAELVAA
ncbi:MAG TPA: helix-turn-helix domain-containing protein, partial [Streptosporangiaceae bacterium]|nr:helix-turn-helix domain-containing protein [Streptosporangiaceae bacterium]